MIIKPIWHNAQHRLKLVILGLLLMISGIFSLLLGYLIANIGFDINLLSSPNLIASLDDPNTINALKTIQLVQQIGIFIIPALLFALLCSTSPLIYLRIKNRPKTFSLIASIIIMIFSIPLINFLAGINESMRLPEFLSGLENWMMEAEANAKVITTAFLNMDGRKDLVINMVIIALIPAIGEELLFRGALQNLVIDWSKNIHLGIWITAILFSAMHMQFYGFLPRMAMGLLFGYLVIWTGSIWIPVFCHFTNNGSAVLYTYLNQKGIISDELDNVGTGNGDLTYIIVSSLIVLMLLVFVFRNKQTPPPTIVT